MQSIACAYTHAPLPIPSVCRNKSNKTVSRLLGNDPLFKSIRSAEPLKTASRLPVNGSLFESIQVPAQPCLGADGPVWDAQAARAGSAARGGAAGLVSSQTSGTPPITPEQRAAIAGSAERRRQGSLPPGAIQVDPEATRLKRLRSTVLTAARLHVQEKARWKVAMLTLTYRPDVDWASGQISTVVRHIRQWLARKGHEMRFVWVQEFTKKGKPHYHLLLWLPLGLTIPKPDKQRWWPWGMTKIEWARNAVGYIAKYASKGDSLHKPSKGARMHGNGGLTGNALLEQRWWKLPVWLRESVEPSDRVRRRPTGTGGGFFHPDSGEVYESPWEVFFKGGLVYIVRKGESV